MLGEKTKGLFIWPGKWFNVSLCTSSAGREVFVLNVPDTCVTDPFVVFLHTVK